MIHFLTSRDKKIYCEPFFFLSCNVTAMDITFRWNRTDCSTSPDDFTSLAEEFPEPTMGTEDMFNYFRAEDGFNFSDQEVIDSQFFLPTNTIN